MDKPRVTHFEIHAEDPERAIAFYESVFDWEITKWESGNFEYWMITTGPEIGLGINGGLMKRKTKPPAEGSPINAFVCVISVTDLDTYVQKVVEHGGKIVQEKFPIKGIGWAAFCLDPEGNRFGLMESDMSVE